MRPGGEVWAVIQAFGGGRFADMGWPRLPSATEMAGLAGESLAEGAQGILFYTWDAMRKDPGHRQNVCALLTRLKILQAWLPLTPGLPPGMNLKIEGRVTTDPGGSPAIRTGWQKAKDGMLILAVNPTPYGVRMRLSGLGAPGGPLKDLWSGRNKLALAGEISEALEPFGVRAWRLGPNPSRETK